MSSFLYWWKDFLLKFYTNKGSWHILQVIYKLEEKYTFTLHLGGPSSVRPRARLLSAVQFYLPTPKPDTCRGAIEKRSAYKEAPDEDKTLSSSPSGKTIFLEYLSASFGRSLFRQASWITYFTSILCKRIGDQSLPPSPLGRLRYVFPFDLYEDKSL